MFILFFEIISANAFPVIGSVYPIQEPDLLVWIRSRLLKMQSEGKISHWQKAFEKRVLDTVNRPSEVKGITVTETPREFTFDPTITVSQGIRDENGQIIVPAYTRVNPLDTVSLRTPLLFFDGDSLEQRKWARDKAVHYQDKVKYILVKGSPVDLMREWKKPVYFDQLGYLVGRLEIKHVPAIVEQDGKILRIREEKPCNIKK